MKKRKLMVVIIHLKLSALLFLQVPSLLPQVFCSCPVVASSTQQLLFGIFCSICVVLLLKEAWKIRSHQCRDTRNDGSGVTSSTWAKQQMVGRWAWIISATKRRYLESPCIPCGMQTHKSQLPIWVSLYLWCSCWRALFYKYFNDGPKGNRLEEFSMQLLLRFTFFKQIFISVASRPIGEIHCCCCEHMGKSQLLPQMGSTFFQTCCRKWPSSVLQKWFLHLFKNPGLKNQP